MQIEIKNAVSALNKLYDCTFENVFGLIKTHMNVMQTHIFRTVGETGTETPNGIIKKKQGVDADKNENT